MASGPRAAGRPTAAWAHRYAGQREDVGVDERDAPRARVAGGGGRRRGWVLTRDHLAHAHRWARTPLTEHPGTRCPTSGRAHDDGRLDRGGVFVVAYVLIALERWDRTLVALIGGLLVIVLGVIDQREAFAAIDLNVIFLLAGMMVIASVLGEDRLLRVAGSPTRSASRGATRSVCS